MTSFKAKYGQCNTPVDTRAEQRDYAIMLLNQSPFDSNVYVISHEFGELCISTGNNEAEALDNAADDGKLTGELMSDADRLEYESNGWDDSYITLGNDSAVYWCENMHIAQVEVTLDPVYAVLRANGFTLAGFQTAQIHTISRQMTRLEYIYACMSLDLNGCYSDEDNMVEFGRVMTLEEARECYENLMED